MKTKLVTGDLSAYKRLWQGIPGVEVTGSGRKFVSLYSGGINEGAGNFSMVLCDHEGAFKPIAVIDAGPEGRAYDPCLWIDPLGRLWFIWAVQPDNRVEFSILEDPDGDLTAWSEIRTLGFDVMLNKPIVAQNGDWLFPCAVWKDGLLAQGWGAEGINPTGTHVFVSRDQGQSFSLLSTAKVTDRHYDEHMLIQHPDSSYSLYTRTRYGIAVSHSTDCINWTDGVDAGLGGPNSRFYIGRLQSGALLLVNHRYFTGRNNLTAMISDDEGKTWNEGLLLDERTQVSYPDVTQAADGTIYIVYDRERGAHYNPNVDYTNYAREILMAAITEEDIRKGQGGSLKNIVSKVVL